MTRCAVEGPFRAIGGPDAVKPTCSRDTGSRRWSQTVWRPTVGRHSIARQHPRTIRQMFGEVGVQRVESLESAFSPTGQFYASRQAPKIDSRKVGRKALGVLKGIWTAV